MARVHRGSRQRGGGPIAARALRGWRGGWRKLLAIVFAGSLVCVDGVMAQNYPTQPLTMVVPFPAGGPVDTLARIVTERMGPLLGQPVIVENVTGAAAASALGVSPARLQTVTRLSTASGAHTL